MKQFPILTIITIGMLGSAACASARDTFRISWRGTAYTTMADGRIVARSYTQKEVVEEIARNNGLDPRTLALVYVHDEEEPTEELEVVPLANGKITTANFIYFRMGHEVKSSDGNSTRRMRYILDEYHSGVIGTIFGSEKLRRNPDGSIASFSYRGRFQFSLPERNTVYVGTFSTGRRIINR